MAHPDDDSATQATPPSAEEVSSGLTVRTPSGGIAGSTRIRPTASHTFAKNDLVDDRFSVVRFIAQGGMGEVYEVVDKALGDHLALKTIRPSVGADDTAVERFKREIQLARRVTHPNICRMHDLGWHQTDGEQASVMFLTMELLPGPNLRDHIAAKGRFDTKTALLIVEQMASGLESAHELGIVHRDFKSANVVLVSPVEGSQQLRAVITDFGLARGARSDPDLESLTNSGIILGTPAYMAPEQVQGEEAGSPADIYALGIVMYEMLTGRRPFEGNSALTVATKRLLVDPPPPSTHVPDLDPTWDTVILRCLQREPENRYAKASEVVQALQNGLPGATGRQKATDSTNSFYRKYRLLALSIVAVAALVGIIFLGYSLRSSSLTPTIGDESGSPETTVTVPTRSSVAVLSFRNVTGQDSADWLSTVITEMLTAELAAGGQLRAVTGDEIATAARNLNLDLAAVTSDSDVQRLAEGLGVDVIIYGSFALVDNLSSLIRVEARLLTVASGALEVEGKTGTEGEVFDLVDRLGRRMRTKLGVAELTAEQSLQARSSMPEDPAAARHFALGLLRLRNGDFAAAQTAFERAATHAPDHPLVEDALAWALLGLGDSTSALNHAQRAVTLSGKLGDWDRRRIEARYHEIAEDLESAIAVYREMFELHPDAVEVGLRLATVQTQAGQTIEALATIAALRSLPTPLSADPRIDLAEAWAHFDLGDFNAVLPAARNTVEKGRAIGAGIIVARGRMMEALALQSLGQADEAQAALEEARSLFEAAGDDNSVADALERIALVRYQQGDLGGADRLLERALEIHRSADNHRGVARVLQNTANLRLDQGLFEDAGNLLEQCLTTFDSIGAEAEAAVAILDFGTIFFLRGDLEAAAERYSDAIRRFSALGNTAGLAIALTNMGEVLYLRGELGRSRDMHEEAVSSNREIGDLSGVAYDTYRLGMVFAAQGDLGVARLRFETALSWQDEAGEAVAAAETRLGLAQLELNEEQSQGAEKTARAAEEVLRIEGLPDLAARARLVLAEALLDQGQIKNARIEAEAAAVTVMNSSDLRLSLEYDIVAARLEAAAGSTESSLTHLQETIAKAEQNDHIPQAYAARLAAVRILKQAGQNEEARRRAEELERDAGQHGFGQVLRRVRDAME